MENDVCSRCGLARDKIRDSYAWPPRPPLTPEERGEAERLSVLSARLADHARCAGFTGPGGLADVFGAP